MGKRWVVNASPLILLGKVKRTPLLLGLAEELIIPDAVAREVQIKADGQRSLEELQSEANVRVASRIDIPRQIAAWDLGRGESEVLAQALDLKADRAVVDDLEARRCAQALGVEVIGTLGIVLRAKRKGLIQAARPILMNLRRVGLYVSDDLLEKALAHLEE